jgi:hypothetical protein
MRHSLKHFTRYCGWHAGKGILVLLTFWIFGITYVWSLFDAYSSAQRINRVGF